MNVKTIAEGIKKAMSVALKPVNAIPTMLLLCETLNRPGLSATALAAAIITRFQQAGLPTGNNPDGSENLVNKAVLIVCEEFVNHIHNNAVVEVPISPGSINIMATGGNAGGPVEVIGSNNLPVTIRGLMR